MAGRLAELYANLLVAGPLAPELHEAIWHYASRRRREDLLEALVRRDDTPALLRSQFPELNVDRLRIAFLSRPDVTEAEAEAHLAEEGLYRVLAGVASARTASSAVMTRLAGIDDPRVALLLAANPTASPAARVLAIETAARHRTRLPENRWTQARNLVRDASELHETLARSLDDEDLLSTLARAAGPRLSPTAQERLVKVFVEAQVPGVGAAKPLRKLRGKGESTEAAARNALVLLESNALGPPAMLRVSEIFTELNLHPRTRARLDAALGGEGADPVQAARALARSSGDVEALAELAGDVGADVELAEALAGNPALPSSAAIPLLPLLDVDTTIELLAAHPRDDELVLAACRVQPPVIESGALARVRDPSAAAVLLAQHFAGLARPLRELGLAHLASVGALAPEQLATLTWRFVCDGASPPAVAEQAAELMGRALARDRQAWAVLDVEGDGFSGTLGELIERCLSAAR